MILVYLYVLQLFAPPIYIVLFIYIGIFTWCFFFLNSEMWSYKIENKAEISDSNPPPLVKKVEAEQLCCGVTNTYVFLTLLRSALETPELNTTNAIFNKQDSGFPLPGNSASLKAL